MRRRQRSALLLQVTLVLVAGVLGVVENLAANDANASVVLKLLQKIAVPGIGVLLLALVVGHVIAFRLEKPPPPARQWDAGRAPYPGLDAFAEDEAAVFFGREGQINALARRLHETDQDPGGRFIALVGASGSGKSSLVQAGVGPRLKVRRWAVLPVLTPGSNPIGALAQVLAQAAGTSEAPAMIRRLRQDRAGLARIFAETRAVQGRRFGRTLLIIDQFEELLTLAGDRERELFLDAVTEALRRDHRLWVLATVRIEFLKDFLDTPHAGLFQNPAAIGSIGRTELVQAIEQPGALVGMDFAPGLVELIADDAGTSDALPLLAYLLQELYFAVGPNATVAVEDYRRLGGVAGALARQADQVVAELRGTEGVDPILSVLLQFVTTDGQEVTRRRVALNELSASERRMVDAFVDARILVTDLSNGQPIAHVAHEALFRQWPPLRQEVEARAEQLRQRAELERWAVDWHRSGRSTDYLLTGERFALAQQWLAGLEAAGQASEAVRELVEVSRRRDLAFLRRVSEGIGLHVLANAEQYPELSILLSVAALAECAVTPVTQRALMSALAFSHAKLALTGHTDTVRNLTWSPDGTRIATASRDRTARIFDAATGRTIVVLAGHEAMVEMATWSPDSTQIATASRDHTVRVWDATTGRTLRILTGASDMICGVAWSADGRHIAGVSRDRAVRIWAADSGHLTHVLRDHTDTVWGVAWSADGRLATASHDRTVIIWNLETGTPAVVLEGHSDFVEGLAWSPDAFRIATSSGDQTIRVWDPVDGRQELLIRGHGDPVWNVAWSPDGQQLAAVSSDRTARIWNAIDAAPVAVLRGHTDTVWGVAWSPTGTQITTGSEDGTARIWDVLPRGAEDIMLGGHHGPVSTARWSPDEQRIAAAGDDGTIRVWNLAAPNTTTVVGRHTDLAWSLDWSPDATLLASSSSDHTIRLWRTDRPAEPVLELVHADSIVETVAFSPDGARIATGGHDRTIRIWDTATGTPLLTLIGHQDWVTSLAWSPSGRMLASTSDDRTARLWDLASGEQLTVLRGHDNWVDDISWSPDERTVVTSSADWTARIWEVATGRNTATLRGHDSRIRAVAYSPDGTRIATGSDDRTLRVWNAATHDEVTIAGVHRDKVTSVAWSHDGQQLLTSSADGTARIWQADPDLDRLQAKARGRVFRTLTDDERQTHLLPPAV